MRTTKRCPRCGKTLPLADFLRPRAGTPSDYCHPCRRDKRRAEYEKAGGSATSYSRRLLRAYGITLEAYEDLAKAQDGLCAICHGPETAGERRLAVDFDEALRRVCGLVCSRCRWLLSVTAVDPELLAAVSAYRSRTRDA